MNYCLTYYTCVLSSSHVTPFSFSLHPPNPIPLSHAPFFLHPSYPWSHFTPHLTPPSLPCAFIYSRHVSLRGCISILYANLLCLPISLFSSPLCLANYFCSIVHSVWGWTRTPPWPPVRGERLSGTKTSIAPFFFPPSSYPVIDDNSNSTNNMTLCQCVRSYRVQILFEERIFWGSRSNWGLCFFNVAED